MRIEVIETELCPFCKKNNNCLISKDQSSEGCWCFEASFPKEIFDLLPPDREKVCICKNCLEEFKTRS